MKKYSKFISVVALANALLAYAGCGTANPVPVPPAGAIASAVCAAGQVNTVAGCSNGGVCTIPGTYTQGGLVNGTCQAMTGTGVGTGVGTGTCALPGYVYQSQYRVCCPPNLPLTQEYIQYYCQAPLNGVYGQGGSGQYGGSYVWNGYRYVWVASSGSGSCPNGYNPSTGQCY